MRSPRELSAQAPQVLQHRPTHYRDESVQRVISTQKLPTVLAEARAKPRIRTTASTMPVAAERKFRWGPMQRLHWSSLSCRNGSFDESFTRTTNGIVASPERHRFAATTAATGMQLGRDGSKPAVTLSLGCLRGLAPGCLRDGRRFWQAARAPFLM
jgi:hypothetical protein